MSARDSHYSEGHFFCNTFFRFVSSESQLRNFTDRSRLQDLFQATQTTLTGEDTWSHHSLEAHELYVWSVANAIERESNSLENSSVQYDIKNRSPNVWRKCFVFIFHGPTISSAVKNTMDHQVKRGESCAVKLRPSERLIVHTKSFVSAPLTCAKCSKCALVTAL
jgi:hypothetical protein